MPLYKIEKNKCVKQDKKEFKNEAELEKLFVNNLEDLTGIKLIESQYPIPNGRMDTLGIDEDSIPVVIEYKWQKDANAIIQGLFYLDWVKNNKKTLDLMVKEKFKGKIHVNWNCEPRLIIVAKGYSDKELTAINQMKPTIELKKYAYYDGLFNIEDVNITRQKRAATVTTVGKKRELKEYTLEGLLDKAEPKVRKLFESLRGKILGMSDEVWEKVGGRYCDYRTISTFVSPNIQVDGLKIFVKMGDKKINDPQKITSVVPKTYGYGKLNVVFKIKSENQIDYAMELIKQAYDYVT